MHSNQLTHSILYTPFGTISQKQQFSKGCILSAVFAYKENPNKMNFEIFKSTKDAAHRSRRANKYFTEGIIRGEKLQLQRERI